MSSPRMTKVTHGEMLNTRPLGIRHVTEVVHGWEGEQDHTGTCTEEGESEEEDRTVVLKKTKMVFLIVLRKSYIQYGLSFEAPLEP